MSSSSLLIFSMYSTAKLDSVAGRVFDDTHEYVLMLLQVQRLQAAAAHYFRTQSQTEWACDHCTAEAQAPELGLGHYSLACDVTGRLHDKLCGDVRRGKTL